MLVDATQHAGPAMWQGLMLLALPIWAFVLTRDEGKYIKAANIGYAVFGVVLFVLIAAM